MGRVSMQTQEITVHVSPEVAEAYRAASPDDRRKMDLLVGFQLTEFLHSPERLEEVMDEMSHEAQQRGLTAKLLDSILHD
jgi:hypothetical protein